ncbi:glycosyltransferase family 4 protein [Parvimonas micra]|uniref:glycosyltransferase family 4 protein n=1 Tax=Parvimonas micra TaxID=33033 RepID=UPI001239EB40|nr:glycosyltransferase family 4 protein [Parvimonas micra]
MKILHLISQYPSKTGSGIYLTEVYKNFKSMNFTQKVLCAMNEDDIIKVNFDDYEIIKFKSKDLSFPVVGMSDVMPYESFLFSNLVNEKLEEYIKVFTNKITKIVNEFNPDIIFTNHLYIMSSIVASLNSSCKVFAFCHGTDLRQLYKNNIHKKLICKNIPKVDGIFCLSEKQKEEIIEVFEYNKDKVYVIGGGYDLEFYYKGEDKIYNKNSKLKLIYAGKFSRAKGVIYLLKAFEKVKDKYNIELILAGSGTGEEYDEIISYSQKMSDKVKLYGYMDMQEIADLFRSCDIFVMPSFYEGLSLVTIEAMACDLKVVMNELENFMDFVGDDIINSKNIEFVKMPKLFDADKVVKEEVNDYIQRLSLALEDQINNLYNNNFEKDFSYKITQFSWENICNNIKNIVI